MAIHLEPGERYTGQKGLIERFGLRVPDPFAISIVGARRRRTVEEPARIIERYPASQDYGDSANMDLKFALRYEPTDLRVLKAAFCAMDVAALTDWINSEPTGAYARRAWFFYEWLTGQRLDLPDLKRGNYVPALDPGKHYAFGVEKSSRHRVTVNVTGTTELCPMVRRTRNLEQYRAKGLREKARRLAESCDPEVLKRAIQYLYTKETRSTYAIEREEIAGAREEQFIAALRDMAAADLFANDDAFTVTGLARLQNLIVRDPRYQASGYRDFQNYVGRGGFDARDRVDFICPRPADIAGLMAGFRSLCTQLSLDIWIKNLLGETIQQQGEVEFDAFEAVIHAAIISFAFVFIHPFEDGNGRIHRFLIHKVLEAMGFTPKGLLFPVSAVMLRDRAAYDAALESFSKPIMPFIDWSWRDGKDGLPEIVVHNDTADLYRYFDATPLAEYLCACIEETIEKDLREELDFVANFDRAMRAFQDASEMPDRKANLFVRLILQNGRVSAEKRQKHFPELTDAEADGLEQIILAARDRKDDQGDVSPTP